eukprot:g15757.t1
MLAGVRPGWPDPSAEAVLSDASSRLAEKVIAERSERFQKPFAAKVVRFQLPRPGPIRQAARAPTTAAPACALALFGGTARGAATEVTRKAVKAGVPAIGTLVQEQLQMKYGLSLDIDDFVRKVESLCRAQLNGDDWDPLQIVSCLNGIKDMRFRTRDAARILELRLEPRSTESFQSLAEEA